VGKCGIFFFSSVKFIKKKKIYFFWKKIFSRFSISRNWGQNKSWWWTCTSFWLAAGCSYPQATQELYARAQTESLAADSRWMETGPSWGQANKQGTQFSSHLYDEGRGKEFIKVDGWMDGWMIFGHLKHNPTSFFNLPKPIFYFIFKNIFFPLWFHGGPTIGRCIAF